MRGLGCIKAKALLERGAIAVGGAERGSALERPDGLEEAREHVRSCPDCGGYGRLVRGLREAADLAGQETLPARARERALQLALAQAQAAPIPAREPDRRPWLRPLLVAAPIAAAAAAGVFMIARPKAPPTGPQPASIALEERADRILGGAVRIEGAPAAAAIPAIAALEAAEGAALALAHARIEVKRATRLAWDRRRAVLRLDAGELSVAVDPRPRRPFVVTTPRFSVEVLGTRYEIGPEAVRVLEGAVRVRGPDGAILAARVAAGESWRPEATTATWTPLPGSPEPAPALAPVAVDPPRGKPARRRLDPRPSAAAPAPTEAPAPISPEALLADVRQMLARRQVPGARARLGELAGRSLTPAQTAEAETLRADLALVAGDRDGAARLYRGIAERHAARPEGEVALFAAARLEQERGRSAEAAELLRRYLDRHPRGIFRAEATKRLEALGARSLP